MFKRGKDKGESKTVPYDNPPKSIFFQYLAFLTQPNQLKIADFCVSMLSIFLWKRKMWFFLFVYSKFITIYQKFIA